MGTSPCREPRARFSGLSSPGTSGEAPEPASRRRQGRSAAWVLIRGRDSQGPPARPRPRPCTPEPRRCAPRAPIPARTSRRPVAPRAHAPEAVEALLVPLEKAAQVELRAVLAVPFLELLELRVLGERGHGERSRMHGQRGGRRNQKG